MRIAAKGRTDIEPVDAPGIAILSKPSETSRQRHSSTSSTDSIPTVSGKRNQGALVSSSKRPRSREHYLSDDSRLILPGLHGIHPCVSSEESHQTVSLQGINDVLKSSISQELFDPTSSSSSCDCSPISVPRSDACSFSPLLQNRHSHKFSPHVQPFDLPELNSEGKLSPQLVGGFHKLKFLLGTMRWQVDHLIMNPDGKMTPHYHSQNPNKVIDEIQCLCREIYENISATRLHS